MNTTSLPTQTLSTFLATTERCPVDLALRTSHFPRRLSKARFEFINKSVMIKKSLLVSTVVSCLTIAAIPVATWAQEDEDNSSQVTNTDDACRAAREDAEQGIRDIRSFQYRQGLDRLGSAYDNTGRCFEGQPSNRQESGGRRGR